jgi:tRNA threonylcarbamoyladenosine biosynthesis protein TsaE
MLNLCMKLETEINGLENFAETFWKVVGSAKVFAFHGEMGAGKTTTISALCHYKGVTDTIGSPTFSIINEYALQAGDKVFHIDLYRLENEEEIIQAGIEDCIESGYYCFVEWPEKAPWLFDEDCLHVFISAGKKGIRTVNILTDAQWKSGSVA